MVVNWGSDTVSALVNNADGTFGTPVNCDLGRYPSSVAVGDLDGDAWPDLAVVNDLGEHVSVPLIADQWPHWPNYAAVSRRVLFIPTVP